MFSNSNITRLCLRLGMQLPLLLLAVYLTAQTTSITWQNTQLGLQHKSAQKICRAEDGYVQFRAVSGYYFGLSSVETPNSYTHDEFCIHSNFAQGKLDMYVKGVLINSYIINTTITWDVRIERSGSVLQVKIAQAGTGSFNLVYSYNSDANLYYRAHAGFSTGGNVNNLSAIISNNFFTNCSAANTPAADAGLNWQEVQVFDGGQAESSIEQHSRTYMNRFGDAVQTQDKNFSNSTVIGVETVLDAQGRPVLSSLPAPTDANQIQYRQKFLQDASGNAYDYNDFDKPVSTGNASGEVNNPAPVGNALNSVGRYYSNSGELYVPSSQFPYSRIEYGPDGTPQRQSAPGENYKMGSEKETRTFTLNSGTELNYLFGGRRSFEVNVPANDPFNPVPLTITNPINAVKQVSINPDGIETVTYSSIGGQLLAQCVSGRPETSDCPAAFSASHTLYSNSRADLLDEFGSGSVNIHLPKNNISSLKLRYDPSYLLEATYNGGNKPPVPGGCSANGGPNEFLSFQIYDLKANRFMVAGTDYSLTLDLANDYYSVNFLNNYANKSGYFRISYQYTACYYGLYDYFYTRGYEPPVVVTYDLDYSNWALNYYDRKGHLIRSVSPKGINCAIGANQYSYNKLTNSNDFYSGSAYLNNFNTLNETVANSTPNYGPEVRLKVKSIIKSGVVAGPSGGTSTDLDKKFDLYAAPIDSKTAPSPTKPLGGGSYESMSLAVFHSTFNPPTVDGIYDGSAFAGLTPYALVITDPNSGNDKPSTCYNKVKDPGELFVDMGGICGFTGPGVPCDDPPAFLVSFKIKMDFKVNGVTLGSKDIYRTLGTTCDGKIVEIPVTDPALDIPEVDFWIGSTSFASGNNTLTVTMSEVKAQETPGGTYITLNTAGVAKHRFIRYIQLKTEREREVIFTNNNPHSISTTNVYDRLGRLIATHDPDRGLTELIYDDEGKLRFTQNARQRALSASCFNYLFYDTRGRVTETGQYHDNSSAVNKLYFPTQFYDSDNTTAATTNAFSLFNPTIRENFSGTGISFSLPYRSDRSFQTYDLPQTLPAGFESYQSFFAEGMPVKSSTADHASWNRYNYRGELIGHVQEFPGISGSAKSFDYEYDFFGKLKKSTWQKNNANEIFSHLYTYDAAGRLRTTETVYKQEVAKRHSAYSYYLNGALKRVVLGAGIQGLDYVYTIEGRLKSLNHPSLGTLDPGADGFSPIDGRTPGTAYVDVFAFALDYCPNDYVRAGSNINYGASLATNERYDGRIKSVRWNTTHSGAKAPAGKENAWSYEYDWEQNLLQSTFGEYTPNSSTNNSAGNGGYGAPLYGTFTPRANSGYTEKMTDGANSSASAYDLNGNLRYMKRHDGAGTVIDNLTYSIGTSNNRLLSVSESSTYTNAAINHVLPTGIAYTYDAAGDIQVDNERDLRIVYNAYGKVKNIVRNSNPALKVMDLFYDGDGERIRKTTYLADGVTVEKNTLYYREAGGGVAAIVEDRVLSSSDPGYYITELYLDGGQLGTFYPRESSNQYVYRISDHLGNVRATISRDPSGGLVQILSYADYYAWGMTLPQREWSGAPRFRLAYQGQEYESRVGMYGFSKRFYDQRLGRWLSTDPYNQHWSPYLAMSNNPVSFVDPDGGQDGFSTWLYYAGRPGVFFGAGLAYYEDGIKVEGFEVGYRISHYLRSISHYNSSKREYGYWEITEADDIEYVNVFPDHPECTTCTVASPAVGFEKKWVTVLGANEYKTARQVLYNKNGPAFDGPKHVSNAWTSFRKLGPNAEMLYGTLNDAYMVFQGSILLEENMRQLDISEPYVQKGSADHQFAFAATLIPFGRMGGAGKSGVVGGIKSWQGLKAAFKAGKQEMRLAKVATEAVEQVGPLANLKNTSNFAAESIITNAGEMLSSFGIPKLYTYTSKGKSVFVTPHAMKHLENRAANGAKLGSDYLKLLGQTHQKALHSAIDDVLSRGPIQFRKMYIVGGHEIMFGAPRAAGELPAVIHFR